MGTKLYVGNLSFGTSEDMLRTLFEGEGRQVKEVSIVTDRATGQSRGFGFVEMNSAEEAQAAIASLDGRDLDGRTLKVSEARPRPSEGGGHGGGGARRGGPRGGGGGRGGFGGDLVVVAVVVVAVVAVEVLAVVAAAAVVAGVAALVVAVVVAVIATGIEGSSSKIANPFWMVDPSY